MLATGPLSVRWYLGYGLDQSLPDSGHTHPLPPAARTAVLPPFLREYVVDQCVDAGLISGQGRIADATRVQANTAMDTLVPRLRLVVDDELVTLFDGDEVPSQ